MAQRSLRVPKKNSWSSKMSVTEAHLVSRAQSWVDVLTREESKGRGDYSYAMRRVADRLRVPFGFLLEMTYRPPKTISAGRFLTLAAAYDECLQRRKYREERAAFEPNTALGKVLARAADLVAGEEGQSPDEA